MRLTQTLALLATLAIPAVALATPITDIYSTGLGAIGTADAHYILKSEPAGSSSSTATVSSANPVWFQPTGATQWISPSGSGTASEPTGLYTYETTFTIGAGENPATALLNLIVAADDQVDIYLNGILVVHGGVPAFQTTSSYAISSDFVSGTNTLDFVDSNSGGGPTGMYVDASGSVSAVPEPSSMALLGTGLLSVAGIARRKFRA